MKARIKADPNRLSRDLSFEISCWISLNNGVVAKYRDHVCTVIHIPDDGLYLQLCDVLLARNPCDNVSLDGELLADMGRFGQEKWKIDRSLLKEFSMPPIRNNVIITRFHSLQYDPMCESPLRAVLQFNGKNSPIAFYNFFCSSDEHEVGVVVDSHGFTSCVITGIRFSYGGKEYLLYNYTDTAHKSNYLVIEAIAPVTWKTFSEVSRRILYVVGFLTGHFMFGPFLIFATNNKNVSEWVGYENSLPPPCESFYTMTGMNPYWYFAPSDIDHSSSRNIDETSTLVEPLREKLTPFRKRHVEYLMELLDDKDFSFLFYTLVENSMSQLVRMATSRLIAYAACLEIGGNWFKKQTASRREGTTADFLPVTIREELTSRLQKDVDDYEESLEITEQTDADDNVSNTHNKVVESLSDKLRIVRLRIESELFKQPNAEKLSYQFIANGIELNDSEMKLLKGRNRILHGSDSIKVSFESDNPEPYIEVSERLCFEYFALIWRLIMHIIGYKGIYRDEAGVQKAFRTHGSNNGDPFIRDV